MSVLYHDNALHGLILHSESVTPNDSADLPRPGCCGLLLGGAGNVAVVYYNGEEDTLPLAANQTYGFAVARVKATGTTATDIKALYTR